MTLSNIPAGRLNTMRRSQRVCLSVPIQVAKADPGKGQMTESTRTLVVSAHGALFVLEMAVQTGDLLLMKHNKTHEQLVCRVVNFTPDQSGKFEVAVEFEQAAPRFWRVAFPPSDWSPRSPDAKAPTAKPFAGRTLAQSAAATPGDPDRKHAHGSQQTHDKV